MDFVGRFRLALWRCAALALLLVMPAGARAAGNAYVSVTASSGTVVCDGVDFYVVPDALGPVGSVRLEFEAMPGWRLVAPEGGVGSARGGGACAWSVVSEDGANPEDAVSGAVYVGEVVVSGMPEMMLRQAEASASVAYSPSAIRRFVGVSVASDNEDVRVSVEDDGGRIALRRIRARDSVECGSDEARITVSLVGPAAHGRAESARSGGGLASGESAPGTFGRASVYGVACRKDIAFLTGAMAQEAGELLGAGVGEIYGLSVDASKEFLSLQTCPGGELFVRPVTPGIADSAARAFADNLSIGCGAYAAEVASGLLSDDGFSGVVLESWRWRWRLEFSLVFAGGDLVLNPPRATAGWLKSFQERGFTRELFTFTGEKVSSGVHIENETAFGKFEIICGTVATFSHEADAQTGSVLLSGEIKLKMEF